VVDHESDDAIADAVRGLGLRGTDHGRHQMFFGGVGAAFRHADGVVEAAGDPRREAAVEVVARA
jgi:gamma-glutamyltranspeptidase/glutathione hydrolase